MKIEKLGGSRQTDVSSPVITEGFSITRTSESNVVSRSVLGGSGQSACFSSDIALVGYGETDSGNGLELRAIPQSEDLHPSSPPNVLVCAQLLVGCACLFSWNMYMF